MDGQRIGQWRKGQLRKLLGGQKRVVLRCRWGRKMGISRTSSRHVGLRIIEYGTQCEDGDTKYRILYRLGVGSWACIMPYGWTVMSNMSKPMSDLLRCFRILLQWKLLFWLHDLTALYIFAIDQTRHYAQHEMARHVRHTIPHVRHVDESTQPIILLAFLLKSSTYPSEQIRWPYDWTGTVPHLWFWTIRLPFDIFDNW